MHSAILNQIEEMIGRLSRQEQLWLIQRLAHRLWEGSIKSQIPKESDFKSQLVAVAADSEIQAELQRIDHEFGVTETDGLESE